MANLSILNGQRSGETYELLSSQIQIGRDSFCDVVLPTRSVSRQHARILREPDGFYIEDLNSLNGTYINGRRITRRTKLADRDQIRLFDVLLEFHSGAVPAGAATGAPRPAAGVSEETLTAVRPTMIVDSLDAADESRLDVSAQVKLRAVLEITRNLGQSLAVDVFLRNILDTLFQIFPQAARGYILMAEPDGRLTPRAVKLDRGDGNESLTLGPISQSVAQRVMTEGKAILSRDANASDPDRGSSVLEEPVSSMISAPLMGPSHKPLGLIHVDTSDAARQFNAEDLDVLTSAAAVAGHAVEHARLHEAAMTLDRRQRELTMAQDVQLHFLPQQPPDLPGYRFYSFYRAAEDVGGDYFGYIPLPDGRLAIALADVSGKGVSAALLMARLCAEVRYCLAVTSTPMEAIARLNCEFAGPTLGDMFITFLMGVLDPRDQTLTMVNAGHMPPLIRRKSGLVEPLGVDESGPPLGYDSAQVYNACSVKLEPEDVVVMYTDGISEATDPKGRFYGTKGVEALLTRGARDVETLGRQLMCDVEQFTRGSRQSDDICLLCFAREAVK